MAYLYGYRLSDADSAELIGRLHARGTPDAMLAAVTISRGAGRDVTVESSQQARAAIALELQLWPDLDRTAPGLATLRDHLAAPEGLRII